MIIRTWIGGEISFCFHYLDFCLISLLLFVVQSCPTLSSPIGYSTLGLLVPHHLPKFAQVHVCCIGDAIQPSHPLMPSSPSAFNLSQHQGLFQWVSCLHQMTKILSFSFSISLSNVYSGLISLKIDWLISLLSKGLSESSSAPQFEGINSSLLCLLYRPALTTIRDHWEDHSLDYMDLCRQSNVSAF